jgi:hypothetical protein
MEMFVVPEDDIKLQLSYPFIEILDIPETNHTEPDFNGKLKLNYHPELPLNTSVKCLLSEKIYQLQQFYEKNPHYFLIINLYN